MPGFISRGLLWNLQHDYFYACVATHRLFFVRGVITGKFIVAKYAPPSQDRNLFAWRDHGIKKPSTVDVTMQRAKLVTERNYKKK
jgi:hypothetical protein